ncbi:oocyte zinc finger protein XlCOF7.1-like [Spea bombifrons]|uniref:oocyte zinc finger protein XlCOF7.1-like n=1 Tax=Spea bombifrons TaxID=233779 RepID=UPI00234B11ED|nr:oocyte zinc finger protein XlCOF7.1-like [Spea bombifrons]
MESAEYRPHDARSPPPERTAHSSVMEQDESLMGERVLNLTLEILYLLTGEDYIVVKKNGGYVTESSGPGDPDGSEKSPKVLMEPRPDSLLHNRDNDKKILELTNKIIQLLTGEEFEYLGEKAVYKDTIVDDVYTFSSPDKPVRRRSTPEESENLIPSDLAKEDGCDKNMQRTKCRRKSIPRKLQSQSAADAPAEGGVSWEEENTSDADLYTQTGSTYKEESASCEEANLADYTLAYIKEEPGALEEGNLPDIYAPAERDPTETFAKKISSKSDLLTQQRSAAGDKLFECSYCGKCFTGNSDLTRHKRVHTGEKPFSCADCGKCFSHKSNLVTHQKLHTGEKAYLCSECGKSFTNSSNLVTHQRVHRGDKPFSCLDCGKRFTHKSDLVKHQRVHTGEKPFSCSECGKCFTNTSNLVTHQRIHSGEKPYSCSECGKCFISNASLIKHERIHTGTKPFACPVCGKCFTDKSNLSRHRLTHMHKETIQIHEVILSARCVPFLRGFCSSGSAGRPLVSFYFLAVKSVELIPGEAAQNSPSSKYFHKRGGASTHILSPDWRNGGEKLSLCNRRGQNIADRFTEKEKRFCSSFSLKLLAILEPLLCVDRIVMDPYDFSEEMTDALMAAMDGNWITERILNLVMEIVHLLIGKEYIIAKKKPGGSTADSSCSSVPEEVSRTRNLIETSPENYGRKNDKKILDVTQKIIRLLTGEVPVRSDDVAVYFSLEEWEYLEENKHRYKNVMMENHSSLKLLEGSKRRSSKAGFERPNPFSAPSRPEDRAGKTSRAGKRIKVRVLSAEDFEPECGEVNLGHGGCAETSSGSTPRPDEGSDSPGEGRFIDEDGFSSDEPPAPYIVEERGSGSTVYVLESDGETSPLGGSGRVKEEPFPCEERTRPRDGFIAMCVKEDPDAIEPLEHAEEDFDCIQIKNELLSWEYGDIAHGGLSTPSDRAQMGPGPDGGEVFFNDRSKPDRTEQKHDSREENRNASFYTSSDHTLILGNLYAEVEKYSKGNLSVIKCNECGRSFNSKSAYTFHQRASSKGRMYNCSEYQKYFISNSDLVKQPSVSKEKSFSCSECGKCFSWMAQLLKHQWDHVKEKRFTCAECGKRCTCESELLEHQKVHVKEVHIVCAECGKQFTQKEHLALHQKTHEVENREKRFACSECGRSYTKRSHLVRHQKAKHKGAKPCICSECGKSFSDDVYLSKHQMAHTGEKPFWCSDCGKCFSRGSYLIKHRRTHVK